MMAAQNIISVSTSATKALGKVILELNGKLTDMALGVLAHNMSGMYLTCSLEKVAKHDDIKKVVKQVSEGTLKAIQGIEKTRLSFVTSTVISTFLSSMLGLALPVS